MLVIHINGTTQQFIADNFNEGVVPQLEQEDTYFLVGNEDRPNVILSAEDYYDHHYDDDNEMINIIKN